jgi:hypothetical protein
MAAASRTVPSQTAPSRTVWGGIFGPAAFVSAWVVGGAIRRNYSPVNDAISQLAAVGTSTRPLMSAGFVGFGVAVPVYAVALRASLPGPAWKMTVGTGLATLAVASFPLGISTTVNGIHGGCAAIGYATMAATPLLASRPLAASGRRIAARVSVGAGAVSAVCLVATLLGPAHGLFQRVGLTIGDAWLVATAVWILRGGRAVVAAAP